MSGARPWRPVCLGAGMYLNIDCEAMRFVHKHPDFRVVANLEFIELQGKHVHTTSIESERFDLYTEAELQLLYKNMTGATHTPHHGDALRAVLRVLAQRYPVTDVDAFEADRQAAYLEAARTPRPGNPPFPKGYVFPKHQYVKGAKLPQIVTDLWAPARHCITLTEGEAANAARTRIPQPAAPLTVAPGALLPAGTRPAVPARVAPEGGTVALINKVADEMWEGDGRPTGESNLRDLRKRIMAALESKHGLKPTARNKNLISLWQKARF